MQILVDGGSTKVYTGPKKGKFYVNKHGKKVYLNRAMLNDEVPYKKATKAKKPTKAKKMAEGSVIMNE